MGALRGLRTLERQSASALPLTMRRAWLALNMFSLGGLPALAAVGLRRRWLRGALLPAALDVRLSADRISFASF